MILFSIKKNNGDKVFESKTYNDHDDLKERSFQEKSSLLTIRTRAGGQEQAKTH